jgi:hypothetical protein
LFFCFNFMLSITKWTLLEINNEARTTLLAIPMENSTRADRHAACQVLCCLWNFADVGKLPETTQCCVQAQSNSVGLRCARCLKFS